MKTGRLAALRGAIWILTILLFAGCGVVKRGTVPWDEESDSNPPEEVTYSTPEDDSPEETSENFVDESAPLEVREIQEFLHLAYTDWKGTPYQLGGADIGGIDCSAFVQVVFEDYLSKMIPRTTREQLEIGEQISQQELRTGDLIFFKTGRTSYHVGIMINSDEFLHASTSNGVKLSELNHPYWQETYLTTRRIF